MISENKDNPLQTRIKKDEREIGLGFIVFGILVIIIIANLLYLNYLLWQNSKNNNLQNQTFQQNSYDSAITPIQAEKPTPTPLGGSSIQAPILKQSSTPNVKEYYIPLGTGTNTQTAWTNVSGTETTINFNNYQNIKEIHFEASISIPTSSQFISVRLFNITDKHPVWNSQVNSNGSSSQYLVSEPIIYDGGLKTYQVQMLNQLSSVVNLLQARLRIILK